MWGGEILLCAGKALPACTLCSVNATMMAVVLAIPDYGHIQFLPETLLLFMPMYFSLVGGVSGQNFALSTTVSAF